MDTNLTEQLEEQKEIPFHHIYVTVGHPLSPTAVVNKIVVRVNEGKSERFAAIKARNDIAKKPQILGFPYGLKFQGQDLYYAIFHTLSDNTPVECSENYNWRRQSA